ncbi:MAG: caspase family protein [Fimbriimonadaceae bacterium]|nr:caspase family protein [Fimbriimonadaceae bacterium]
MRILRTVFIAAGLLTAALGAAQSWRTAYEQALTAATQNKWAEAREGFLNAVAMRPEDVSDATVLPGPPTQRDVWRGGSPYSPNFGAAYSAYRAALAESDDVPRQGLLQTAAMEFGTLLDKGQRSAETFYFLHQIYVILNDAAMQREVEERRMNAQVISWKVDTSFLSPEEKSALAQLTGTAQPTQPTQPIIPGDPTTTNVNPTVPVNVADRVPVKPNKYALVIGNSESLMTNQGMEFATNDAMLIHDTLVQHAGYADDNVIVIQNGTAADIMAQATALAERMEQDGTLVLFFAGAGFNIDGKDYLAGVDATSPTDTSMMVGKVDMMRPFIAKGTQVFMFFEVRRPNMSGRYFGQEIPLIGSFSQMQATIPGGDVYGLVRNGSLNGIFARSMANILALYRTNQVPLSEYGWQVFNDMRRGGSATTAAGGSMTPTLPTIRNMVNGKF